jgi:hypothetical protein
MFATEHEEGINPQCRGIQKERHHHPICASDAILVYLLPIPLPPSLLPSLPPSLPFFQGLDI